MASNGDQQPEGPSASPSRSASISLQAAATLNAGLQREPSPRSSDTSLPIHSRPSPSTSRRRSNVLMNLQLNDPSVPAPGEMVNNEAPTQQHRSSFSNSPYTADPHHHRAPSLGELHQELEAEQEAHVNRLLQTIRQQQLELQRLQAGQGASAEDTSAISDRPVPPVPSSQASVTGGGALASSLPRSPGLHHPRSSIDFHRQSRTPSRGASPRLRSTSISAESGDLVLGGRDESAFYQAETQMLTRENQMLRHRIRDLEKLLSETPNDPAIPSQLSQSNTATDDETEAKADN